MASNFTKANIEEVKSITLSIHEVEEDAVIVNIEGWRMRIYFEEAYKETLKAGGLIEAKFTGELKNPHSIKFRRLK